MNILPTTFLIIASSLLTITAGNAQEYQPHADIIAAATTIVEASLTNIPDKNIVINPLDRRLTLRKCNQPLHAFLPAGAKLIGRTTIGVRCKGEKPWKLFVTASIAIFANIIVADDYIERGTLLQTHHIKSTKREISTISRGYFTSNTQVTGKIVKYAINKDGIIHPASIRKPKLVKRGKEVVIQARSGGIIVKMRGTAVSDGALGDLIRIKNKRSRRIIQAEVIGTNIVEVIM